jgi:hypothetical protein
MAERSNDEPRAATPAVTTQDVAKALADLTRAPEGPTGENASTDPKDPAEHFFLTSDGRKVNAYGEEKGSKEDRQRMAALGYA